MDVWPVSLPQSFKVDSDQYTMGDTRVYSRTDSGVPRMRRRSSAVPDLLSGEMVMNGTQLAALRTFWAVTTAAGSLPFNFTSPYTGGTIICRFSKDATPSWKQLVKHETGTKYYSVMIAFEVLP
jgi:hypothetical protein